MRRNMRANTAIKKIKNETPDIRYSLIDLCLIEVNGRIKAEYNVIFTVDEIWKIVDEFILFVRLSETIVINGSFVDFIYQQQKVFIERANNEHGGIWYMQLEKFLEDSKN